MGIIWGWYRGVLPPQTANLRQAWNLLSRHMQPHWPYRSSPPTPKYRNQTVPMEMDGALSTLISEMDGGKGSWVLHALQRQWSSCVPLPLIKALQRCLPELPLFRSTISSTGLFLKGTEEQTIV